MGKSHHRKKHKTQLRQYQQSNEGNLSKAKRRKVSGTIAVIGAIVGMSVGYFTTNGVPIWIAIGAVVGGISGFLIGRFLDKG